MNPARRFSAFARTFWAESRTSRQNLESGHLGAQPLNLRSPLWRSFVCCFSCCLSCFWCHFCCCCCFVAAAAAGALTFQNVCAASFAAFADPFGVFFPAFAAVWCYLCCVDCCLCFFSCCCCFFVSTACTAVSAVLFFFCFVCCFCFFVLLFLLFVLFLLLLLGRQLKNTPLPLLTFHNVKNKFTPLTSQKVKENTTRNSTKRRQ